MTELRIVIDKDRCKGCGLCTTACPGQLLHIGCTVNRFGLFAVQISAEGQTACTSCALCARSCPDVAITVFRPDTPETGKGEDR